MLRVNSLIIWVLVPSVALFAGAYLLAFGVVDPAPKAVDPAATGRQAIAKVPAKSDAPTEQKSAPQKPAKLGIDIASIDSDGTSVIAGIARPSADVTVLADGVAIGTVKADKSGDWVLVTEYKFANPNPKIALKIDRSETSKVASAAIRSPGDKKRPAPSRDKRSEPLSVDAVTSRLLGRLEKLVESANHTKEPNAPLGSAKNDTKDPPRSVENDTDAPSRYAKNPDEPRLAKKRLALIEPTNVTKDLPRSTGKTDEPRPGNIKSASAAVETNRADTPTSLPVPLSLPIPIKFIYREAQFTDQGKRAAALLLRYVKLKKFETVSLTGHADERGSKPFNMALSRDRLDAIAQFLRDGGYRGKLNLIPKGETAPFTGVDRSKYSVKDLYELDRRVELQLAN